MEKSKQTKQNEWKLLPIHTSRIIKNLDKAILIKIDDETSTILPKVFKRVKEKDNLIFFSLPKDFKINIRTSRYDEENKSYKHIDAQYPLPSKVNEMYLKYLKYPLKGWHEESEDEIVEKSCEETLF